MYLARKNPRTVEEADKSIKSGEETDKSQESAPTDLNGFNSIMDLFYILWLSQDIVQPFIPPWQAFGHRKPVFKLISYFQGKNQINPEAHICYVTASST